MGTNDSPLHAPAPQLAGAVLTSLSQCRPRFVTTLLQRLLMRPDPPFSLQCRLSSLNISGLAPLPHGKSARRHSIVRHDAGRSNLSYILVKEGDHTYTWVADLHTVNPEANVLNLGDIPNFNESLMIWRGCRDLLYSWHVPMSVQSPNCRVWTGC